MHNKIFSIYKKLEFWQKVIIFVSILAVINLIVSISIMLSADNIQDLIISNVSFTGVEISLLKVLFTIVSLIVLCIFTLIL